MVLNSLLAIGVGFYLSYTLETWTVALCAVSLDSYSVSRLREIQKKLFESRFKLVGWVCWLG